ncbi:MAG: hypothetical protein ABR587_12340 [Candidatus Binatia bacterium]
MKDNSTKRTGAILSAMLAACMFAPFTAGAGGACPDYDNKLFCGELTNDCQVTATDALAGLRMAVGQLVDRPEADLDNSGAVTAPDALRILRIAVGDLPSTFSCGPQYGIKADAVGFYDQEGVHTAKGYAAGWYASSDTELRNYFVFDLSPIEGSVDSAILRLASGSPALSSDAGTETYTLFDIGTDVDVLKNGTGGVAAFNDLAAGTVYGALVALNSLPGIVEIPLNHAGATFLWGSAGRVALGGAVTTLSKGAAFEYFFNSTGSTNVRELIVTVD